MRRVLLALLLVGAIGGCGSTAIPTPPQASSANAPGTAVPGSTSVATSAGSVIPPSFDPASFSDPVDNPWFPLKPGMAWVYQGTVDGQTAVDTVTVEAAPKAVAGVTAAVVHHELALNGEVARETDDWYAPDRAGDVWLLGVATTAGGEPNESDEAGSPEGSWQTGVDGAQPGIVMPANPRIGDGGLQELDPGKAEDHFVVLLTDTSVRVPAGTFSNVLLVAVWSRLVPDVLTEKAYVKGTGEVREADVAGGDDVLELVKVTTP